MDQPPNDSSNSQPLRGRMRVSRSPFVYERPHAIRRREIAEAVINAPEAHSQTTALTVAQLSRKMVQTKAVVEAARTAQSQPGSRRSWLKKLHRSTTKSKTKQHRKYRRPLIPTLVSITGVAALLAGGVLVVSSIRNDREVKAQVKGATAVKIDDVSEGTPSEDEPPTTFDGYVVAPDTPRLLTIEHLNTTARVRPIGMGINNLLESPSNIFDAGWYHDSAKPGEEGTMVMDGHVAGATKRGIFYNIGSLKAGDKISVERGDSKLFTYIVTGSQVYDNDDVDMARLMKSSKPGKSGLNLITCPGRFNIRTNEFERRVVVFAVLDS